MKCQKHNYEYVLAVAALDVQDYYRCLINVLMLLRVFTGSFGGNRHRNHISESDHAGACMPGLSLHCQLAASFALITIIGAYQIGFNTLWSTPFVLLELSPRYHCWCCPFDLTRPLIIRVCSIVRIGLGSIAPM